MYSFVLWRGGKYIKTYKYAPSRIGVFMCRIVVVFKMNINFYSSVLVCFCVVGRDGVRKNISGPRKCVWFILFMILGAVFGGMMRHGVNFNIIL